MTYKKLYNKIALVTGASRGIGEAIARRFAKEGCNVAITYLESEKKATLLVRELEKEGIKALAIQINQANPLEIASLVKKIGEHFGKIDILVNNAGIYVGGFIDDLNLDLEGLSRQLDVNVKGVFATTHTAVPFMGSGSRIIMIGSINGERMISSGGSDYAATKAALVGYTHGLLTACINLFICDKIYSNE